MESSCFCCVEVPCRYGLVNSHWTRKAASCSKGRRAPPVTESLRFAAPAARTPTEGTLERGVARALVARHLRVRRDCNQPGRRGTCRVGRERAEWTFRPDSAPVRLCLQRHGDRTDTARAVPDDRARCWIIWEWGQVALTDGDHLLGRDADVAVWLESPTVSRHHARIRILEEMRRSRIWKVRTARTCGGERLVTPATLTDGDEVRIGSVTVRFRRLAPSGFD